MLDFDDALKAATGKLTSFITSDEYRHLLRYCTSYHHFDKPFAFVGGFFYRRILEEYHNYPFGSEHCDIDILFFNKGLKKNTVGLYAKTTSVIDTLLGNLEVAPGTPNYKKKGRAASTAVIEDDLYHTSMHISGPGGRKVDLIYIGNMAEVSPSSTIKEKVEAYWDRVPFHIQQVAAILTPSSGKLEFWCAHAARAAIINCDLSINCQETLTDYCEVKGFDQKQYMIDKKKSLRFNRSKLAHLV